MNIETAAELATCPPGARAASGPSDVERALLLWTSRAELGLRFDLAGEDPAHPGELTRARFDGSRLILEHWLQGSLMAGIELRRASTGEWRAIPACGGLAGERAHEAALIHACDALAHAFSRLAPTLALDWTRRLRWAAPWARKGLRIG